MLLVFRYTLAIYPASKKWSEFSSSLQFDKDLNNLYDAVIHKIKGEPFNNPFVERVKKDTEDLKRYVQTAGINKQLIKEIEALKQKLLAKQKQKQK